MLTVPYVFGTTASNDECESTILLPMITSKSVEVTRTQKPLENKATFRTSVSSDGATGVILKITRPLFLIIKKYSVASSALLQGKEMNWHNGSLSPMAMLCLVEQFGLCNSLNFIVIRKNGNELFLMRSLR